MQLHFDEDFLEAAVFLCANGRCPGATSLQRLRFNREREKLYSILDPDQRNEAFFKLHLAWFREWGLEKLLTRLLPEFPGLAGALNILAFRRSLRKNDDGAELYVNESGDRNGVVSLRPERMQRPVELAAFLRHELMHLQDMIDPAFGYRSDLALAGASLAQQRLARERYRLVWDVSIDGRLTRAERQTIATQEQRRAEFARAFPFWAAVQQQEAFDLLWHSSALNHDTLEHLACDHLHLQANAGPVDGAACPLCSFPCFSWATEESLTAPDLAGIRSEFPHWNPEQGVCKRCLAVYRVANGSSRREGAHV